jgi:hypothetical protein
MAKSFNRITLIITILVSIILLAVQGRLFMDTYEWLPSESAPEKFPMTIIKGDFELNDGSSIYIPSKAFITNGWGKEGSIHCVGEKFKALPVRLIIVWFSFTEDKFFGGSFDLPKAKISELFKKGQVDLQTGEKFTYSTIIVGMAPEGEISIWLEGEEGTLEVATFKANEVRGDWKTVLDNPEYSRSEYLSSVLEDFLSKEQIIELQKNGIPKGLFEKYKVQYSWDIEISGSKPLSGWIKTYNGERESLYFRPGETSRTYRSVPKSVFVEWENKSGKRFQVLITMDETEIFKAYQKISSNKLDHNMKLRLDINEMTNEVDAYLKDSQFILKLEKNKIKVSYLN